MTALTREKFEELTKDLPEDGFRNLIPILMESFGKGRGRTLDKTQVASLCVGFMEMSATIDSQITYIGELQREVEECQQQKKNKLWTPK